jgi:hypothetical protein
MEFLKLIIAQLHIQIAQLETLENPHVVSEVKRNRIHAGQFIFFN